MALATRRPTSRRLQGPDLIAAVLIVLALGGPPDRGQPPHATVDVRAIAADPSVPAHGRWVPWLEPESGLPYRLSDPVLAFAVSRPVVDAVGLAPIREGLTALNGTVGSAVDVSVHVARTPDRLASAPWRVVLDPCRGRQDLAHVELAVDRRDELAAWVHAGAIVLCEAASEASPRLLSALLAHELGHVLGLGHLCRSDGCQRAGRSPDPCGYMFPAVHPCQDPTVVAPILPLLYPSEPMRDRPERTPQEQVKSFGSPPNAWPSVDPSPDHGRARPRGTSLPTSSDPSHLTAARSTRGTTSRDAASRRGSLTSPNVSVRKASPAQQRRRDMALQRFERADLTLPDLESNFAATRSGPAQRLPPGLASAWGAQMSDQRSPGVNSTPSNVPKPTATNSWKVARTCIPS
jgi:hypothetical protein